MSGPRSTIPGMRIREETSITTSTREEYQESIIEAIRELEQQHEDGVMETPAYLIKKRALIRML